MKINLECPVCRAKNELSLISNLSCRRCKEDLSLLYRTKAYSYKYRLFFVQLLVQPQSFTKKQQLMQAASHLVKPSREVSIVSKTVFTGLEEEE
jgi:transposase-like protein